MLFSINSVASGIVSFTIAFPSAFPVLVTVIVYVIISPGTTAFLSVLLFADIIGRIILRFCTEALAVMLSGVHSTEYSFVIVVLSSTLSLTYSWLGTSPVVWFGVLPLFVVLLFWFCPLFVCEFGVCSPPLLFWSPGVVGCSGFCVWFSCCPPLFCVCSPGVNSFVISFCVNALAVSSFPFI